MISASALSDWPVFQIPLYFTYLREDTSMDAEIKMAFFLVSLGADFNQGGVFSPFTAPFLKEKNSSQRNGSCSQDKWV